MLKHCKEISKDWYRWCRLCANQDIQNVKFFLNDEYVTNTTELKLSDAIGKYLCVEITKDEQLPNQLCTECFALVTTIVNFNKRVTKVQEMYIALLNSQTTSEIDIQALRLKYDVLKDYRPLNIISRSLEKPHLFKEKRQALECINNNFAVEANTETIQPRSYTGIEIKEELFAEVTLETDEDVCDFENEIGEEEDPFASDIEVISKVNENSDIAFATDIKVNNKVNEKVSDISNENKTQKRTAEESNKSNSKKDSETTEYKFFCRECPLKFRRIGSYRLHLNKKHNIPLPTLTCSKCSRTFKSEYDLKKHTNTHRPPSERKIFPCPQCDRKFQKKDYVTTHIKFVHEDIRPFICEECGETMRTQAALREHMLTHTDYTPFVCDICKKGFKNRARLKKHLETHSSNKYTCSECGLQLNSRATLNRHKLVHSDEMPHKCDYCGRAFKRAKTLKMHLIVHSGLKPYSCDFCDKTFANGANCRTHKLKSHPEELAALEASGDKPYTKNIPKLSVLKTVTRTSENLTPVVCKQSVAQKRFMEKSLQPVNFVTSVTIPPSCW